MFFSYVENGSTAIKFWTTITYTLPPFLLLVKLMSPCKQKMKHQYFWIPLETCLSLGSGAGRTSKISGAEQKWTDGRIQYEFWVEILFVLRESFWLGDYNCFELCNDIIFLKIYNNTNCEIYNLLFSELLISMFLITLFFKINISTLILNSPLSL